MNLESGFVAGGAERKYFGAYYTPVSIARAMANWAISSSDDRVIEPSFGDGAFLAVAEARLTELGSKPATFNIAASDIDPDAIKKAASRLVESDLGIELREADFLAIEPAGSWSNFAVALGNPPYVRHHRIAKGTIADMRRQQLGLTGGSDLWCSFVAHSMSFLRPGGRLAFILPGAFQFAHYAQDIRDRLAASFAATYAIRLAFPAFAGAGADERGVVVLCAGYGEGPSLGWEEHIAWDEADLADRLQRLPYAPQARTPAVATARQRPEVTTLLLGEVAKISIGTVTGANRYFIVNDSIRQSYSLPNAALVPMAARTAQTPGIVFSRDDHKKAAVANARVWLFAPACLGERHGPIRRYLATIPRVLRRKTVWFHKRPRWYQPQLGNRPDAVFTYMNHLGPRIVLLEGAEGATNTFHAVKFYRREGDPSPSLVALSMLTSYAQLSAERIGRAYGGGVLKVEPSEARKIALPIPTTAPRDLKRLVMKADRLLKAGDADGATMVADEAILRPMFGATYLESIAELRADLAEARSVRLVQPRERPAR